MNDTDLRVGERADSQMIMTSAWVAIIRVELLIWIGSSGPKAVFYSKIIRVCTTFWRSPWHVLGHQHFVEDMQLQVLQRGELTKFIVDQSRGVVLHEQEGAGRTGLVLCVLEQHRVVIHVLADAVEHALGHVDRLRSLVPCAEVVGVGEGVSVMACKHSCTVKRTFGGIKWFHIS